MNCIAALFDWARQAERSQLDGRGVDGKVVETPQGEQVFGPPQFTSIQTKYSLRKIRRPIDDP